MFHEIYFVPQIVQLRTHLRIIILFERSRPSFAEASVGQGTSLALVALAKGARFGYLIRRITANYSICLICPFLSNEKMKLSLLLICCMSRRVCSRLFS